MKGLAMGIKRFLKDEEGVTMIEYGLLAALISIVCILAITLVGNNLNIAFETICNTFAALSPAVRPADSKAMRMGGLARPALSFLTLRERTLSTSQAIRLPHEQQGVTSIEYALLACLIAVSCVLMITAVGTQMETLYGVICNGVAAATGQPPC
jgi:pilus assembly protein Flp/PilA